MGTDVSGLLEIQELDTAIDRLRGRKQVLESQIDVATARAELAAGEGRVGELRMSLDASGREQRRLESDIESLDRKSQAEQTRLYDGSVANAKELQSIEHEVQNLRSRKSRIEDQLLEMMEQQEDLEGRLGAEESRTALSREHLVEIEATSASELVQVEADLRERTEAREGRRARIDPEVLELYEDLRRQKKGVGAAALVEGVCHGCNQKLSPVYLDRLRKSEGIWRCEYCRRILVSG